MSFNIQIPQINLHIDSEQISDVLDFIKFQNYTTVYGKRNDQSYLFPELGNSIQKTANSIQFNSIHEPS
jgi:hypothetical protein